MHNDTDPQTGSIFLSPRPADMEETFVLLPVVGEPGEYISVFSDGSYTRWIPAWAASD